MLKQIAVVQMELGMSFGIGMRMYLANRDDAGQKGRCFLGFLKSCDVLSYMKHQGRHYYLVAK